MTNLKAYKEKQNEIVEKMQLILDSARLETRALNETEKTEYETLKAELEALKETIKLLQEELQEKPMTEEEGKKEDMEQRNLSKELLEKGTVKVSTEKRNLQATTGDGKKTVATGVHDKITILATNDNDLVAHIPFITTEDGAMTFVKETELGDLPQFVAEGASIADSDPSLENVVCTSARIGSSLTLSKKLAHSSAIDIVEYAQGLLGRKISKGINKALIKGAEVNGTKIVEGLEQVTTTGDKTIKTGGVLTIQDIMDVLTSMPRDFVSGSKFVVSTEIFNELNKLQDGNGQYYLVKDVQNGTLKYLLFGLEVLICDEINSNLKQAKDILYLVNFEEAYKGIIKENMNIEVHEFEAQKRAGNVLILGDVYLGAVCTNPQAIVKLKGKVA